MDKLIDYVEINPRANLSKGASYPFVEMKDLSPDNKFVSANQRKPFKGTGSKFQHGDTLLARITPCLENGKTSKFISANFEEGFGSSEFIILREKEGKSLNDFIYYLCRTKIFRDYAIQNMIGTSGRQRVPNEIIASFEYSFPSIKEQEKIIKILNSLDNKIENNKKTNQILEEIAKALFKSWFIDFEPVKAKSEGRSTGLPNEISDLFPDSFEDSELGEIPHEWAICNIDDLLDLEKNSINPIESPEEIFDHYSIPAFDDGHNPTQDNGFSIKSSKFLIPENTFLVCKLNPRFPRVWLPSKESSRRRISSTEFLVCKYKKNVGLPYAYYLTKSFRVTQAMRNMATGTSSSHQRLRPKDFTSILTVRPNPQLLDCFTDILFPFLEKSLMIRDQNILLKRYRDTVLPKLISGDLRIPDAEKIIEEVGI